MSVLHFNDDINTFSVLANFKPAVGKETNTGVSWEVVFADLLNRIKKQYNAFHFPCITLLAKSLLSLLIFLLI